MLAAAAPPSACAAVVVRAADTPLRPALPGVPGRLAGSGLARLVEPGAGSTIAVDLIFAGAHASTPAGPDRRPMIPPASASTSGGAECYEFTYVLDGRGAVSHCQA